MPATELVSYFAGYEEMAFVLGNKGRELLFRLTPAAFDNDRVWWGQSLATAAAQQGDMVRARAYADSSLAIAKQQIDAAPTDPQLRVLNAVMLGLVGRQAEAIREAELAVANSTGVNQDIFKYVLLQYIRVLIGAGKSERALDNLEMLMKKPYHVSPGYLRSDPMFRPLKGNPRFERLATAGSKAPVD